MDSAFFYRLTLHRDTVNGLTEASWVPQLPLVQQITNQVAVLAGTEGVQAQGMYVYDGTRWRFVLPYNEVTNAIVVGATIDIFYAVQTPYTQFPSRTQVWRNGLPNTGTIIAGGDDAVWAALTPPAVSEGGDVSSVNDQTPDSNGNVALGISDIPGLQTALDNAGSVKTVNGNSPDANGNVAVAIPVTSVSGQQGAVVISAAPNPVGANGVNPVLNTGSSTGTIILRQIVGGTGVTAAIDGNGNIDLSTTPYTLPVASTTVLGGVKQGSGISIAGDGTISATNAGSLTAVNSEGTGTSLVDNNGTTGGIATIKSLAQGSNITITAAGDGKTLTIAANQVLNPATTTTIGGVIVKAGLAVDGVGNLSLAAPTGVNLGGVKQGTGVTIASDGTISASGAVASVSGQTGAVVVSAVDTSTASGTTLITSSGSTTGTIVIRRIVAGSGISLGTDGNNNLQISSTATGGVSSITAGTSGALTGAITFTAGQSISLSNTGNTVQISGTGVPDAPNDGNLYGRENLGWTLIPALGSAITSVTGQTGTGAVLLVESSPPANSAIIKSLVAGTNVTITENSGLLTIAAAIPGGTVSTVNGQAPNGSGAVTLTAANLNAVPVAGNVTMTGPLNMGSQVLTGLTAPVNASDAVPYSFLQNLVINGGVIG